MMASTHPQAPSQGRVAPAPLSAEFKLGRGISLTSLYCRPILFALATPFEASCMAPLLLYGPVRKEARDAHARCSRSNHDNPSAHHPSGTSDSSRIK
ncbi:hypothetical protein SPHINGO391_440068 [Sphingomonas aurantiaca]|uniref:Uncharacterized protein n=1 Tax=Sphingomonas aurantiaca TaxID=185949 RepID=A0A5E7Z9E5_9SPHN|nr:hypothetical protein SPHINGO391_440068 [Sphingomonas aurantiaca]